MVPLFCLFRICLGISTGFFSNYSIIPCMYVLFGFSLYLMSIYIRFVPMKTYLSNKLEILNFVFIYFSAYFMILFSNWLNDVELNYIIGQYFNNFLITFCSLHAIFILHDLFVQVRGFIKKKSIKKNDKQQKENDTEQVNIYENEKKKILLQLKE